LAKIGIVLIYFVNVVLGEFGFFEAVSRFTLQSFEKRDFTSLALRAILFSKGFPLQSGLSLPRGPSFRVSRRSMRFSEDQIKINFGEIIEASAMTRARLASCCFRCREGLLLSGNKPRYEVQRTPKTKI